MSQVNKRYIDDIKPYVTEIIRQMAIDNWRPDYVVGLTRGGLYPAILISEYLEIPMYTLKVSFREGANDCDSNTWMPEDIQMGKRVLIVDDINDTGRTINWIVNDWDLNPGFWGDKLKVAVLIDNLASYATIKVDYKAETIDKDKEPEWIVFPWEEWWV